jgi:hypothetical protein
MEGATFRKVARLRLRQVSPNFKRRDSYFRAVIVSLWLTLFVCGGLNLTSKSKSSFFEKSTHMKIAAVMFSTLGLVSLLEWRRRKLIDDEIRRSFNLEDFRAVESAVEQKHGRVI